MVDSIFGLLDDYEIKYDSHFGDLFPTSLGIFFYQRKDFLFRKKQMSAFWQSFFIYAIKTPVAVIRIHLCSGLLYTVYIIRVSNGTYTNL